METVQTAPPSQTVPAGAASQKMETRAGKYLTFQLGAEEFAIKVLSVREIMGVQDITAVPQVAGHVKGVLNLRGRVIPVVDLRLKFGLEEAAHTQRTCIIVVQVEGHGEKRPIGVIVDAVSDVVNLQAGEIEDTPDFGDGAAMPHLVGMAKIKGKVKILLDIDRVLSGQDTSLPGAF